MSTKEIFLSQFKILSNYNSFISKKRAIRQLKSSYTSTIEELQKLLKIAENDRRELGHYQDCGDFYQEQYKEAKNNLSNFELSYSKNLINLVSEKIEHEKLYKRYLHEHKENFSEESYHFILSIIDETRQNNIENSNKKMKQVRETSHKNECLYKLITILFGKRLHNHIYLPSFKFDSKDYRSLQLLEEAFNKKECYPSKDMILSLVQKHSNQDTILLYAKKALELLNLKPCKKSDNYIKVINDNIDIAFK